MHSIRSSTLCVVALVLLAAASAPAARAASSVEQVAEAPADTLAAGCGGGIVAQGWTVTLTRDGLLSRTSYGPNAQSPQNAKNVNALRVKSLFKRAESLTAEDMPHAGSEVLCTLAVMVNGEALDGQFPFTLGTEASPLDPTAAERLFLGLVGLANGLFGKLE